MRIHIEASSISITLWDCGRGLAVWFVSVAHAMLSAIARNEEPFSVSLPEVLLQPCQFKSTRFVAVANVEAPMIGGAEYSTW